MANIDITFCVNNGYVKQLATTLVSILENNKNHKFNFYVLSSDFSEESKNKLKKLRLRYKNCSIRYVLVDKSSFQSLKLNIEYISLETYYRYVIADLLPDIDKVLYLDADLVVNGNLEGLWSLDLEENYLGGVADLYIEGINHKPSIGFKDADLYVNAGVLLMNLKKMRQDKMGQKLIEQTERLFNTIKFQDQDILNIVFKGKIKELDQAYNFMTKNAKKHYDKVRSALIIHYTGKTKPWNKESKHRLKKIYKKYEKITESLLDRKIKVGLIIDEFFGGAGTAFGGYGFLARRYIAKYIPDENIQIDVLLGKSKGKIKKLFCSQHFKEDNVDLYRLPRISFFARRWLKNKNYDIYLSIELVDNYVLKHEVNSDKKLILWIQDPRPKSAWDNDIDTMQSIKDPCFFSPSVYKTAHEWNKMGRVKFISQGYSLNPLAIELYDLPKETPIQYLPNPIDIDFDFKFDLKNKKKNIIFLGRLEAQKRCWMFCEVAKRMPEYDFYVLGQFFRHQEDNKRMLEPYMNGDISNLHFVGHVDGEEKKKLIRESRILLSTAIWEGIPISWLEALSYGTVLVADLEREGFVERFGRFVGQIPGDGFDGVNKFVPALKELMDDDVLYQEKALAAIEYIRGTHNVPRFVKDLRNVIMEGI